MLLRYRLLLGAALAVSGAVLVRESEAASLEVNVRAAFGGAGRESPVAYEPVGSVRVEPTAGPIWDRKASPYGIGGMLQGGVGLRTPFVSFGVNGGTRSDSVQPTTSSGSFDEDGHLFYAVTRSAWFMGPYVRGYIPGIPDVDPWIGLGVQYIADTQSYTGPVMTTKGAQIGSWTLEHYGVAVPITLGIVYTIAKVFSIGPSFEYAPVIAAGACAKVSGWNAPSASFCADDSEDKRVTSAKSYGVWSFGLSLRLTVPRM
jgi:hypothetical protein